MARFRINVMLAMAGNLSATISLAVILITVARLGSPELVGQLSYCLAICTPVFQLALMRLRDLGATEASISYSVRDFLAVSFVTNQIALIAVTVIAVFICPDWQTVRLCFIVGLWRLSLAFSETVYGYHQRQANMSRCASAQITRSLVTMIVFVSTFWLTRSLSVSIGLLCPANLLIFLLIDFPTVQSSPSATDRLVDHRSLGQRILFIISKALPLGLSGAIFTLNLVIPRTLLEHNFSFREVGLFAAVAFLARCGTPAMQAVGQTASSRLAIAVEKRDRALFGSLLVKVTLMSAVAGFALIAAGWAGGQAFLIFLYGPEYQVGSTAVVLIMCYATLIYMSTVLTYGLIAARRFTAQLVIICLTVLTVFLSGCVLIPEYGITGCCISLVLSALVRVIGTGVAIRQALASMHFSE